MQSLLFEKKNRRFCIAPMMDYTDRHCRFLFRLLFPNAFLYSEMVTIGAVLYGNRDRFLRYSSEEQPLALQLGGSEPGAMALCARIAEDYGYSEVNINVGCPSERVRSGAFGACLMAEPYVVAQCVEAMCKSVRIPVTVKTRIGIDDCDDYEYLKNFVSIVKSAGCQTFIIHARKAWLKGLSPKENREIPPLNYAVVYQLKREFPELEIIINGGLKSYESIMSQFEYVDGVMIGREAYQNPFHLLQAYRKIFNVDDALPTRVQIVEKYLPYVCEQLKQGVYLQHVARHMMGLFQGVPGARKWRRYLSEHLSKEDTDESVIVEALNIMRHKDDCS